MEWGSLGIAAIVVATLYVLTPWGRDQLARMFPQQAYRVNEVVGDVPARQAFAYMARLRTPSQPQGKLMVVLGPRQAEVAETLAYDEGATLAIDCLLAPYRVVPNPGGWAVVVLPGWLAWLGTQTCEHGGMHAAPQPGAVPVEGMFSKHRGCTCRTMSDIPIRRRAA